MSREFLAVIAGGSAALCFSGGLADSRRTNDVWLSDISERHKGAQRPMALVTEYFLDHAVT